MTDTDDLIKQLRAEVENLREEVRVLRERPTESPPRGSISRRSLLMGAGAAAAGIAAGVLNPASTPALATDGQPINAGQDNTDTNTTSISGSVLSGPALRASNYYSGAYDNYSDAFQAYTYGDGFSAVYGRNDSGGGSAVQGMSTSGVGLYAAGSGRLQQDVNVTAGPPRYTPTLPEQVRDGRGVLWISGQGGGWMPVQPGGWNNALYTAVSTQQYILTGSNGSSWIDIDPANLALSITPRFNCLAVLMGNADLWTSTPGLNQDIGIFLAGTGYGSGQILAWKESGGGTPYSPTAAYVQTVAPMAAGTSYVVKLQWKASSASSGSIWIGAGPSNGQFSPTRLTALLIVTS